MWKFSLVLLSLITIGNSSTQDQPGTTDISRNFRNYENQGYEEKRSIDDREDDFESDELIGKWRNSGTALEPKWRDGDALPLVPFDETPRRKKLTLVEGDLEKSVQIPEEAPKVAEKEKKSDNVPLTSSIEVPIPDEHYSSETPKKRSENLEKGNDESATRGNVFSRREKFRGPKARSANARIRDLTGSDVEEELLLEMNSRSRYGDAFQNRPNEYELSDEEYQKPRPRKRRPPQNDEFVETRSPTTYSVSWSTETYEEDVGTLPVVQRPLRKLEITTRRGEKKKNRRRDRNFERTSQDQRRRKENAELKSLLKMQQVEGLSLSELLQRRNFTLNDLLRGKTEALNVLKSSDSDSSEIVGVKSKIFEPQKLFEARKSPVVVEISNSSSEKAPIVSKGENDVDTERSTRRLDDAESSVEKLDSAESEVGQRISNENEKISAIVRLTKPIILPRLNYFTETSTLASTEKTGEKAVDNFPKEEKNSEEREKSQKKLEEDEIMEFSDFTMKKTETTTSPRSTTARSDIQFHEDSGSTLSIENILSSTQKTGTNEARNESSVAETRVSVVTSASKSEPEVLRVLEQDYQSDESRESGKTSRENANEKSFDSEELTMGDQPYEEVASKEEVVETEPKRRVIFSTSSKPYELAISEIEPEARAEIFELFSSGSSAKRLERLLKSRNMSIDELIELRKRGSSKVHLAEIVRSRENSRNFADERLARPETSTERIPETTRSILPETTTDDLSDVEMDSSSVEKKEDEEKIVEERTNISFMGQKTRAETRTDVENEQLLDLLKAFDSLPFSVNPEDPADSLTPVETKISLRANASIVGKASDHPRNLMEVGVVEEILERESKPVTEKKATSNYTAGGEKRKNFSKVRPSIIASGAILGVTIVVFLAIFVVCRIRQKQKYTYRNSFSRAVFQSPALTARKLSNSSSLNTIMVNVVATSTTKRPERRDHHEIDDNFDNKSDIENDSLDANDSWETIPDFMK